MNNNKMNMSKDLIDENLVLLDKNLENKKSVISLFGNTLKKESRLNNLEDFEKDVYEREEMATTAIGDYIAIPHAISCSVDYASLVFIRLNHAILWNNDDRVKYIFGIAVPKENKDNQHLKILSTLARKLLDETFKNRILNASNQEECINLLKYLE